MTACLRASVLSAALLLFGSPLHAASLRTNVPVVGSPASAALTFVQAHLSAFGVRQAQLVVTGETALVDGRVLRVGQVGPHGLPVLDAEVAVVVMKGRLIAATGALRRISSFTGAPKLDRAAAEAALLAENRTAHVARAALALQVRGGLAQAVWVLTATTRSPWNSWKVLVDARSGKIVHGLSTRRHARAQGLAYLPSPAKSGVKQVTLQRLESTDALIGSHADVQSCGYEGNTLTCARQASTLRNNDYLLATPEEPSVEDAFSEVHMYYHVDTFHQWLKDTFAFKRKAGQQIKVFVNFYTLNNGKKRGMANAFFGDVTGDGKGELVFGQSKRDFAYDGDVVYHEFTHSAIDETSNLEPNFDDLGYNSFPLALNEAFADLISCVYTGDGDVGEYAGGDYTTGAIRSLGGKALSCTNDLIAESHNDGLIWGRFVWALRGKVPSTRVFDQVLYKTMVGLSKNASFADAAKLLSSIATATDAALGKQVDAEIEARGLLTECNRVIPLTEATPRGGYMLGTSSVMGITYVPAGLQYRIDTPADAKTVTIRVEGMGHMGPTSSTSVGAFIRKGATVSFTGNEPQRDFTMQNTESEFVLEREGKNLLVPGASYYVLPLNVGQYGFGYQISVTIERAPLTPDLGPSQPDAGADLAGRDSSSTSNNATGGGGCAVSGVEAGAPLGLSLLLLGLLALRRRR